MHKSEALKLQDKRILLECQNKMYKSGNKTVSKYGEKTALQDNVYGHTHILRT